MCGRAAQTLSAVQAAASTFRVVGNVNDHLHQNRNSTGNSNNHHDGVSSSITTTSAKDMNHAMMVHESNNSNDIDGMKDTVAADNMKRSDNYNMSPGMDAIVFWVDHSNSKDVTTTTNTTTTATSTTGSNAIHPKIQMKRMTWGLLSQNGTTSKPLEKGMNKHFTNLMYNARSDTLYEKVTFHNLCSKKQSCIIALDGYFEWKTEMGKKQPYFVYRNKKSTTRSTTSVSGDNPPPQQQHSYLLLAGLWKRIITGWSDEPSIDTFTMLTTEVCPAIQWLHTRMPVLIWDHNLAIQWLQNPASKAVHDQLVYQSQQTNHEQLQWHKVITSMSSMKFRTIEAILPYKDKQQSVKSFFTKSVPSSTTKTKDDSDDDVVEVLSSDQFHNSNNIKKEEDNISETAEQRPIVRETTASTPTKKRTVGDDPTVATKLITTNNHSASTKRKKNNPSSTTPSKPSIMNSNNTRTIDSFFTPKSTRK